MQNSNIKNTVSDNPEWDRFWFSPADAQPWGKIRIGVAAIVLYWLIAYSTDLVKYFGPQGLAPLQSVTEIWGEHRFSLFYLTESPQILWGIHLASIAVVFCAMMGLGARWTIPLTWLTVLSYAHRAPMLTGPFEPLAAFTAFYLAIYYLLQPKNAVAPHWPANLAARLMQLHLCGWYLLSGLSKLAGRAWWEGDAMWRLAARPDTRLIDLTGFFTKPFAFYAWTHVVVVFELAFVVWIWRKSARKTLLLAAPFIFLGPALLTGELKYFALLCVANLVFLIEPTTASQQGTQTESADVVIAASS